MENLLSEIENMAANFVSLTDMALVLELNPNELRDKIADTNSPESIAYNRGKAKAKIAIRAQEMELAKVGSPLGMASVRENLLAMEEDEL